MTNITEVLPNLQTIQSHQNFLLCYLKWKTTHTHIQTHWITEQKRKKKRDHLSSLAYNFIDFFFNAELYWIKRFVWKISSDSIFFFLNLRLNANPKFLIRRLPHEYKCSVLAQPPPTIEERICRFQNLLSSYYIYFLKKNQLSKLNRTPIYYLAANVFTF